jgi:hypothetical protein
MRRLLMLMALMAAGCGSESAPPPPDPTPEQAPTYPAAYLIDADAAQRLADAGDPYVALERDGRVLAETQWEAYSAVGLMAWLEERGISVDSSRYDGLVARLGEDLPGLAIGPEHAAELRRLRPSERALSRYYYAFTEDGFGDAGRAMLDWLRIFRLAADSADARHVVLIPLVD